MEFLSALFKGNDRRAQNDRSRSQSRGGGGLRSGRSRSSPSTIPPRATLYIYGRATTVVLYFVVVILLAISLAKKASGDLLIFTLFAPIFAICFALCDIFVFKQSGIGTFVCDLITWPIILLPTLIFLASRQEGTVAEKLYRTPKESPWKNIDYMVAVGCILAVITTFVQIGCMFYALVRIPKLRVAQMERSQRGGSRGKRGDRGIFSWPPQFRRGGQDGDVEAGRPGRPQRPDRAARRRMEAANAGMRLYGNPSEEVIHTPLPRYA